MPSPASRRCTLWSSPCFNVYIKEVATTLSSQREDIICVHGVRIVGKDYMIAVQWVQKWGKNYYQCCCQIGGAQIVFIFVQERKNNISVAVCGGTDCV